MKKWGAKGVIQTRIIAPINYTSESIANIIADALGFPREEITALEIRRRELDLSDKSTPTYKMTVAFSASPERECGLLKMKKRVFPDPVFDFVIPSSPRTLRPIVVGAGPAGLQAQEEVLERLRIVLMALFCKTRHYAAERTLKRRRIEELLGGGRLHPCRSCDRH
jgi:hypothetical protein